MRIARCRYERRWSGVARPDNLEYLVNEPQTLTVDVNGFPCRVWRKGNGPKLGFLAGFGGLPRWVPFLDKLAEKRTVIVPSLPGFPGATGHTVLDNHLDWVIAVRQLLQRADLAGADLVGSSVGGAFAADMAAIFPGLVKRLVLMAPFGLFDEKDPATDPWAQRADNVAGLMCAEPDNWRQLVAIPEGANSIEWPIEMTRASEAAARALWPLGNTQLAKRLPLIEAPTLVLWGDNDPIMPTSYAHTIAASIKGQGQVQTIAGAGHLAYLDQPQAVAAAIEMFLAQK
ncbi:alpha/beta hydrolase [Vineibacter terrae]|uniref:Alpha/beta hydrolase n=1 Tax=Vineibacter terrae TaxID=2586908 RepID=A0A5C8P8G4_9HYPH|nr:alpha/beta hydrolase [Vineibacter terrae]